MKTNHFNCEHTSFNQSQEVPLSREEILKGNKILLKFMDFDCNKSEKWIIECALYDKSYNEIMKVAAKIDTFWDDETSWINGKKFNYKHLMFHQVMNFNAFYRRTVSFVESYYKWLSEDN